MSKNDEIFSSGGVSPRELSRRRFMTGGVGGLSAVLGLVGLGGALYYLYPQAAAGGAEWIQPTTVPNAAGAVGKPATKSDMTAQVPTLVVDPRDGSGVYILNTGDDTSKWVAYTQHCTHLQCPVGVVPPIGSTPASLLCPCHGSTYDLYGHRTGGPAPANLPAYGLQVQSDGTVLIGQEA